MPDGRWPAAPAIYQIYPRSFADHSGTGTGDIPGATSRLDHVASLGVDAVWLAPFYTSPLADGGYDIADYTRPDPRMGSLGDFDAFVTRAHDLGLRVMIDMVFNHTSAKHPWFQRALEGDAQMAERYLFADPKPDGTAPNNWLSQFGPPAWTWAHTRRQYFFHQFLSCQPSLNLRNPDVQADLRAAMRLWQSRGVDGFRFDAVTAFLYNESLADNPPATPEVQAKVAGEDFVPYTYQDHVYDMMPGDGAAYADHLREWTGPDAYLLGESTSGNHSVDLAMAFSEPGRLDGVYTTDLPGAKRLPVKLAELIACVPDWQRFPHWLSSHDQPRHVSSAGDGSARDARLLALAMAVLPGPWLLFQGEELGLPFHPLSQDEVTDPLDLLYWPDGPGRENARVPIPWDDALPNAGFTTGTPWLPMRWANGLSVTAQNHNDRSVLAFYRRIVALRRDHAWGLGQVTVAASDDTVLHLRRETPMGRFTVLLNFGDASLDLTDMTGERIASSTDPANGELPRRAGIVLQS